MPTFYISDLDGTLLRPDASLSHSSRLALQELIEDGVAFSVASARSVNSMRSVLHGLELRLPVIEFNGAFISDLRSGRHEVVNDIDAEIAREIFAAIRDHGLTPFVSTFDGEADALYYAGESNAGERHYIENRIQHNDDRLRRSSRLEESLQYRVMCLTVIARPQSLAPVAASIIEKYGAAVSVHLFENQYSPGWYWLTIHDWRATKDQAIRTLMERYQLADHQLFVFGDHENDIGMFRIATRAIAVANAHPNARRHATHVIGDNSADSVSSYIKEHRTERSA